MNTASRRFRDIARLEFGVEGEVVGRERRVAETREVGKIRRVDALEFARVEFCSMGNRRGLRQRRYVLAEKNRLSFVA